MCMSKPKVNVPDPVAPPQESKTPETSADAARKNMTQAAGMAGSTWLTGPSGVENAQLNLGKTTLLGG